MTEQQVLVEFLKQRIEKEKIFLYADSLKVQEKNLQDWVGTCGGALNYPVDGIKFPYAHSWQRKFTYPFEAEDFLKFKEAIYYLLYAGNQGGKSVAVTNWVMMECLGIHPLQQIKERPMPPIHWWIVSPNLPSESDVPKGEDAPILKTIYEWMPDMSEGFPYGIKRFYRKDKLMSIVSVDGKESIVNFKSHDQDKNKFKGERVDGIAWDEMPPYDLWKEGVPRILAKKGKFLLGMTPDYGSIWTAELLRKRLDSEYYVLEMDSLENPFMPVEHRKKVLDTLSEEELMMRRFGKHIQFKGKVFPFEFHKHVKQPFVPAPDCTIYTIIDWHPAKPIVITYLAINPKNVWFVFRESVIDNHVVEAVAREYFSKLTFPDYKLNPKKVIIDKIANIDQVQDGAYRPKSIVDMLKGFGINCRIGNAAFESAQAFLTKKLNNLELFFDPACKLHIDQWDTWGAKRYQKGNLEGTLRDQLEVEGNDTCMNLVYAYNDGAKWHNPLEEEIEFPFRPRSSTRILYGRR